MQQDASAETGCGYERRGYSLSDCHMSDIFS